MRLIDSDALMEILEAWRDEAIRQHAVVNNAFASAIIAQVRRMPTIEPERRWIPVSEKAHPDLPIRVQVQMNNGWIITAYYQDGEWLSVPNCEDAIHDEWIEAWRELPEPYREDIGKKVIPN